MPSPFPGMDPYIEHPDVWSDFHGDFAGEIRARLNAAIRPRYLARMTPYTTYETVEIERPQGIRPDVGVREQQRAARMLREASAGLTPAPVTNTVELEFSLEIFSVEIQKRDTLELVTAIEILSPANKKRGHPAYDHYLKKRRDLLYAQAHLVEIDLLRGGTRPPLVNPVPRAVLCHLGAGRTSSTGRGVAPSVPRPLAHHTDSATRTRPRCAARFAVHSRIGVRTRRVRRFD